MMDKEVVLHRLLYTFREVKDLHETMRKVSLLTDKDDDAYIILEGFMRSLTRTEEDIYLIRMNILLDGVIAKIWKGGE